MQVFDWFDQVLQKLTQPSELGPQKYSAFSKQQGVFSYKLMILLYLRGAFSW